MKGIRFYLEYENNKEKRKATVKNPGNHKGTVVGVYLEEGPGRGWSPVGRISQNEWMYDCACAVFDTPNSSCATSSVSWGYLQENCKRIPERLAREIHPRLIQYLEN